MKLRRAAIAACALVAALAFANPACAQVTPRKPPAPPVSEGLPAVAGMDAPDFSVEALDGKRISLGDFRGKLVLLVFWSTG